MKYLVLAALLIATGAPAQKVVMSPADQSVLRTGTPVTLRIIEGLTTKDKLAKLNDRVRLEVAEAVSINDLVVIPAGSPAVGELTDVRNKGMWASQVASSAAF